MSNYPRVKAFPAIVNAATLDASPTSSTVHAAGYNQCTLFCFLDYATSTTSIAIAVDVSNDKGTSWFTLQEADVTSPPTVTLADRSYVHAISAADDYWVINFPFMGDSLRVRVTPTGGAVGDKITIDAWLSFQA